MGPIGARGCPEIFLYPCPAAHRSSCGYSWQIEASHAVSALGHESDHAPHITKVIGARDVDDRPRAAQSALRTTIIRFSRSWARLGRPGRASDRTPLTKKGPGHGSDARGRERRLGNQLTVSVLCAGGLSGRIARPSLTRLLRLGRSCGSPAGLPHRVRHGEESLLRYVDEFRLDTLAGGSGARVAARCSTLNPHSPGALG